MLTKSLPSYGILKKGSSNEQKRKEVQPLDIWNSQFGDRATFYFRQWYLSHQQALQAQKMVQRVSHPFQPHPSQGILRHQQIHRQSTAHRRKEV